MAKILITLWQQDIFDHSASNLCCYYEGLIKELQKFGHQIFVVNKRLIAKKYSSPEIRNKNKLIEKVKQFNPDLVIAFNNQIFEGLLENTTCPIALFDADGVALFSCVDLIKQFQNRYYMVSSWKSFENYEEIGILKSRIFDIHTATAIVAMKEQKKNNISFIGTRFVNVIPDSIMEYLNNNSLNIYSLKREYWRSGGYDLLKKHCPDLLCNEIEAYQIFDERNYILTSVLDLGLKLYGVNWIKETDSNLNLMSAYDNTLKYSLIHNQDIYNSSKINLSISHPQCKGYAYPWRCYDIMASSGILICSYSKLLEDLTKGYVKIPMYHSPYDARELCKYALSNPTWCEDIISASNDFIAQFGRWESNFKTLEEIFNIKLINDTVSPKNEVIFYTLSTTTLKKNLNKILNQPLKMQCKNIICGMLLILINLPFFNLLFNKKLVRRIYRSIANNRWDLKKE